MLLEDIDFKTTDIDVDEDGLMWLVEEDDWKSAAKDTAMSDMKDEYTDDTETASKVWHSKRVPKHLMTRQSDDN